MRARKIGSLFALSMMVASADAQLCYQFKTNTGSLDPAKPPSVLTLSIATLPAYTFYSPGVDNTYDFLNDPNNTVTLTTGASTYVLSRGASRFTIDIAHSTLFPVEDAFTLLINSTQEKVLANIILAGPLGTFPSVTLPPTLPPLSAYSLTNNFIVGDTFGNPNGATSFRFNSPVDSITGSCSVTISPGPQIPIIKSIQSASSFGGFSSVAPGTWIEIYGNNLSAGSRSWNAADFSGNMAPTSLDGTTVTIGGVKAFIDYVSPGQINALLPSNTPLGSQQVVVATAQGPSAPFNVTVNATEPGLLSPSSFTIGGVNYAVGILPDGAYALPAGAISGVNSRPAKPGDVLTFYGVGFGPVVPSSPAGQVVQQPNTLASTFQMAIGGVPVGVFYSGLAVGETGVYQFNVSVPELMPTSAATVTFSVGGVSGTQKMVVAIGN